MDREGWDSGNLECVKSKGKIKNLLTICFVHWYMYVGKAYVPYLYKKFEESVNFTEHSTNFADKNY